VLSLTDTIREREREREKDLPTTRLNLHCGRRRKKRKSLLSAGKIEEKPAKQAKENIF